MRIITNKTPYLNGEALLPGSKSQSIRAMFLALLAKGHSILSNVLNSDDTEHAIQVCLSLGAKIDFKDGILALKNNGMIINQVDEINTGNSGITTRFILPILGLRKNFIEPVLVNCDQQMKKRPMQPLLNALETLGMKIRYREQIGQLPISVSGQLKGGEVEIDGTSSQYLSALLISLPCAEENSVISVKNLHERPYVEMTLSWLNQQGIHYIHQRLNDIDSFFISGRQCYQAFTTTISGDFSAASCLLAAATLIPGRVELHGLEMQDTQGDKQLVSILQKMGADIVIENKKIKITGGCKLKGTKIDANDIPDLIPALAVIATCATDKTHIYNVKQARIKETDRIHSICCGLRRMGVRIEEQADGMTIYQSHLTGALLDGYADHRTVMALTIAGLLAKGKTEITDGEAISKTYPHFVETIKSLGARVFCSRKTENKHIILLGFKHVGKTLIGRKLAKHLQKKFIDLDKKIEKYYEIQNGKLLSCRQIMQLHGESYYREYEQFVLKKILKSSSAVIALGGGAILNLNNQEMIKPHFLLHVTASRGIVFERIMAAGIPAFFNLNEEPYDSFNRLWEERNIIYKKLASYRIENDTSLEDAINQAKSHLNNRIEKYE